MLRDSVILQDCPRWSTWSTSSINQDLTSKIRKNPTTDMQKPNYAIKTSLLTFNNISKESNNSKLLGGTFTAYHTV